MSESQSRRDEDPIQATPDEKRAAFEWLRSLALDDSLSDTEQRYAAVALQAWHLISQEATELRKLNASLASETKDRQALIDAARYRFLRDNPDFQIEFTGDLTLDEHVDRGRGMFDDSRNNGGG